MCCTREEDLKESRDLLSSSKQTRGCTDIVVLIIFVLFLSGMIFIAAFSISKGDPFRLVYHADSFGNTCDEDNTGRAVPGVPHSGQNLKGRPYLFFMDVTHPDSSARICVNKCPETDIQYPTELRTFSSQTGSLLCNYDVQLEMYDLANKTKAGPCPVLPVYKSEVLLNHCIPRDLVNIKGWLENNIANNIIAYINKSNIFTKVLRDLYASWNIIIAMCFIALIFSVVLVLMLRCLPSVAVWLVVANAVLASCATCAFLWWTFLSNKYKLDREENLNIPLLEVDIDSENAFLAYSIIATGLTLILFLVLLLARRHLPTVTVLLRESGYCVSDMPLLLVQPAWTFVLLLVFFIFWVSVLAFLCTTEPETVAYFWWYHLVGLLWISEFILSCQSFVVAGAVARWYFTREKKLLGHPIFSTVGRLIVFHQGSVALGALILTPFRIPRLILLALSKRFKCICCVTKCLRFLSDNAFTYVAASGKNFCTSARKSYHVLDSNALRLSQVNLGSSLVLFLAKVAVTASSTAISIIWFKSRDDLHFYAIPVLLVSVLSFYIAHCFLSVYEMIIDALLLCFCEDREINDGSADRQYYCSRSLMMNLMESSKRLSHSPRHTGQTQPGDAEMEPAQV